MERSSRGCSSEWSEGPPVTGFKHLFRVSVITSTLALVNVVIQAYLATLISRADRVPTNTIWAAIVALLASCHMLYVTCRGKAGAANMKFQLALSGLLTGAMCILIAVAINFTLQAVAKVQPVSSDTVGRQCVYFNSTYRYNLAPFVKDRDPLPCSNCDTAFRHNFGGGIARRSCCCCVMQRWWYSSNKVSFHGVASCEEPLKFVYPLLATTCSLYMASFLMAIVSAIISYVLLGQCCCSANCGPFAPHLHWNTNRYSVPEALSTFREQTAIFLTVPAVYYDRMSDAILLGGKDEGLSLPSEPPPYEETILENETPEL